MLFCYTKKMLIDLTNFKNKLFMKKLSLLSVAALIVATSFTSCKKDYTCTCTTSGTGISASSSTVINDTKANAEETCDKGDATTTSGSITITTACEIK